MQIGLEQYCYPYSCRRKGCTFNQRYVLLPSKLYVEDFPLSVQWNELTQSTGIQVIEVRKMHNRLLDSTWKQDIKIIFDVQGKVNNINFLSCPLF